MEHWWNDTDRGNLKCGAGGLVLTGETLVTRRNFCTSTTSYSTSLTRTDLEMNPYLRCEGPATNRLSLGAGRYWKIFDRQGANVCRGLTERYRGKETAGKWRCWTVVGHVKLKEERNLKTDKGG